MSFSRRKWRMTDYPSVKYKRMDHAVTVYDEFDPRDDGHNNRGSSFLEKVWYCVKMSVYVPAKIIDFVISNVLRLKFYMYWKVTGRLPTFIDKYNLNEEKVERLSSTMNRLEAHNAALNEQNDRMSEEKLQLEREIASLHGNVHTLETEKQDALTRLSELVSVKLRDNNPNIVDLNDQYRPTKLAEMFSELYDNEWTSAYTILEEHFGEKHAINFLLYTVMGAYWICEERVDASWSHLMDWFLDMHLPGAQQTSKWLKDSRKTKVRGKIHEVEKDYELKLADIFKENKLSEMISQYDIKQYITKCIELSLLMVATDPPILPSCPGWTRVFNEQQNEIESRLSSMGTQRENAHDEKEKEGVDDHISQTTDGKILFEKDMYKEYTIRGSYLDFVVWPALFLHKEGPMLSKGIAQGKNN